MYTTAAMATPDDIDNFLGELAPSDVPEPRPDNLADGLNDDAPRADPSDSDSDDAPPAAPAEPEPKTRVELHAAIRARLKRAAGQSQGTAAAAVLAELPNARAIERMKKADMEALMAKLKAHQIGDPEATVRAPPRLTDDRAPAAKSKRRSEPLPATAEAAVADAASDPSVLKAAVFFERLNAELLGLAEVASQVYQPGGFVIDGLKGQLDAVPTREQMISIMADMIAEAPEDSFMSAKSVSPTKRYIGLMGITLMGAVKKTSQPLAPALPSQ